MLVVEVIKLNRILDLLMRHIVTSNCFKDRQKYHQYSQHKRSGFPVGSCDTAAGDGRRGSNVYEVNQWLWQFGRGKPRLGGLSVERTGARKEAAQKERLQRGVETRQRRKADRG